METSGTLDGPWQAAFWVRSPLPIRSKSNFRQTYTAKSRAEWQAHKDFSAALLAAASSGLPPGWELGPEPGSKGKDLIARRPCVVSVIVAETKLDAANISKSALDACEGVVYWQDSSVRLSTGLTSRGPSGDAWIAFALLPAGSSMEEILEAGCELARQALPLSD